jgi:hypothetical protein
VNSLFVIVPYKYEGMWVFDDPEVGLSRKPFIAGIDIMIDKIVARIPDSDRGFRAVFSAAPFPGYAEKLKPVKVTLQLFRRAARHSLIRCFSSQTRSAASKRLFVRVSVPTAAGSRTTLLEALFLRGRPRRAFVLPTLRAVSLRGRWPTLFMITGKHLPGQSGFSNRLRFSHAYNDAVAGRSCSCESACAPCCSPQTSTGHG